MKWIIYSYHNSIFGRRIAKMLGMQFSAVGNLRPGPNTGVFICGMYRGDRAAAERLKSVPKICYWCGTDIVEYEQGRRKIDWGQVIQITDSPWLTTKMWLHGMPYAMFVPMPITPLPKELAVLPEKKKVMLYAPRHVYVDGVKAKALIRAMPDTKFIVAGRAPQIGKKEFPNAEVVGWVEGEARLRIFRECRVFVRLMKHDGMSQSVAEFKSIGRHVIWTYPAPFSEYLLLSEPIKKFAELTRALLERPVDSEAIDWYGKMFDVGNFKANIDRLTRWKKWGGFPS